MLGIGASWTIFVLGLHTIWSISVPIALMETLAAERALTPWLGKVGLGIVGVLFVFGVLATTAISVSTYQFVASMPQLVAALVVVAVLVWVALGLLQPGVPRTLRQTTRRAPPAVFVGAAALVATSVFKQLPRDLPAWLYVGIELILALGSVLVIWNWSRLPGWGEAQRLALAAGALFTYAWTAFPQTPILPATPTEDLLGNIIFAAGALILVGVAAWQVRGRERAANRSAAALVGSRVATSP